MAKDERIRRDTAGVGPDPDFSRRLYPIGELKDYRIASGEPDIRGWSVVTLNGREVGEVEDLLVDPARGEVVMLEIDLDRSGRHVEVPLRSVQLDRTRDCVIVDSGDVDPERGTVYDARRRDRLDEDDRRHLDEDIRDARERDVRYDAIERSTRARMDGDERALREGEHRTTTGEPERVTGRPATEPVQRTTPAHSAESTVEEVIERRPVVEEVVVRRRVVDPNEGDTTA